MGLQLSPAEQWSVKPPVAGAKPAGPAIKGANILFIVYLERAFG